MGGDVTYHVGDLVQVNILLHACIVTGMLCSNIAGGIEEICQKRNTSYVTHVFSIKDGYQRIDMNGRNTRNHENLLHLWLDDDN